MRRKVRAAGRKFVHAKILFVASAAGLFVAACGVDPLPPEDETPDQPAPAAGPGVEATSYPVVGGTLVPTCGVPMNAKIPGCTATLLTPTILVTAKHCSPKAGSLVEFGEKAPFAFSVRAVKCVSAKDSDSAYCVLPDDERLRAVPTVPVLHGCEYTKFMKAGAKVLGVGFGQTKGTGPARTKAQVEVPVARVRDPSISVGDPMHDLCFGDSGGGAFIHLVEGGKDWGWRLIGTVTGTTSGVMAPCGGTGYTSILRHIKLIEATEGIDITPCTDATGAWAPGPNCRDILTDIRTGGGAWPACNPGPRTALAIDSCGAGPGPAPGAPVFDAGGGAGGSSGTDATIAVDVGGARDTGGGAGGSPGGGPATGGAGGTATGGAATGGAPAGNGGTTASGGAADPGPKGNGGAPGTGTAPPGKASGCSCEVGAADRPQTGAWALALLGLLLVRRRAKPRR